MPKNILTAAIEEFFPEILKKYPHISFPFMDKNELNAIIDNEFLEIGSHTVTHPILTELTPEKQTTEIEKGHTFLEEFAHRKIDFFAYPHGGKVHFDKTSFKILSNINPSITAFSAYGKVNRHYNQFDIKRITLSSQRGIWLKKLIVSNIGPDF
jgi:peptidoglycan/xylan/chitin deacetylase (PgdA/CDA1 family)